MLTQEIADKETNVLLYNTHKIRFGTDDVEFLLGKHCLTEKLLMGNFHRLNIMAIYVPYVLCSSVI